MKYGKVDGYGSVPKKKRHGLVIGILLFLVGVLIVGFLYYKFIYSVNSIKFALNKAFDYLEEELKNSNYDSAITNFTTEIKFNSDDEEMDALFSVFEKLNFSGSYGIDYDKNILNLDFSSTYDDKSLVDVDVYTEYGKSYVYLDGLYDKYIYSSLDNYSKLFEKNIDDATNVVIGIKKAMFSSLKDEYFMVEKVILNNDKVNKTTLDLTGDNYREFNSNMVKNLLNNKVFLESYAKLFDEDNSVDNVKEYFNELLNGSETDLGEKYVLYTNKFKFVKLEAFFADDSIVISNDKDKYSYVCYEDNLKTYSGFLEIIENKDSEGKLRFVFNVDEDKFEMDILVGVSVELNGIVERKDVTNSISLDSMNEEDISEIYNKLIENDGVEAIVNEVSKISDSLRNDSSSVARG